MERRFDKQEELENEEAYRSREASRREDIHDHQRDDDDYVYKKQLRYHDAREQVISRKYIKYISEYQYKI